MLNEQEFIDEFNKTKAALNIIVDIMNQEKLTMHDRAKLTLSILTQYIMVLLIPLSKDTQTLNYFLDRIVKTVQSELPKQTKLVYSLSEKIDNAFNTKLN